MLRLVSSARSRLIRADAFRAADAPVPGALRLAVGRAPFQLHYETPHFFSSDAKDHDRLWKSPAVYSPVAWQETVKPALLAFFKLNKHLMVPIKFVVPHGDDAWPEAAWGYPLGKHAAWLRKQWREGGHRIDQKQFKELEEMEFAWDRFQYKWDRYVLPALRRFYDLIGHTDVPELYRIPKGSPEWPEHLWGQRLGRKVMNIRCRGDFAKQMKVDEDELKRLNFCHNESLYDRDWREKVVSALRAFHQEFGHCNVSEMITVPSQIPWPEPSWGMRLGNAVQGIRRGIFGVNQDKRELEELGFVWNHSEFEWGERVMPALKTFHRLKGHCRVPNAFVVPSDETWPTPSWGMNFGNLVGGIRNNGNYSMQVMRDKTRLEELGFVWEFFESEWSERILPALETYHRLKGHCRVPQTFVVPSDENWPTSSWGLKLGKLVDRIRNQGAYSTQVLRDKTRLEELGFVWDFFEFEWSERIMPAFEYFNHLKGHCRVPHAFVVPSDKSWPTPSWGLKLGSIVNSIRSHETYSTQVLRDKTRLEELGFVWDFLESEWSERILPALEAYRHLQGHCRVPDAFVVPSDKSWPASSWGLKLGNVVHYIRSRGTYPTQISRDKARLERLGFVWSIAEFEWSERILPALEAFHKVHEHCRVPRTFVVPSEATWPNQAHGLKLGIAAGNIRIRGSYFDQTAREMDSLEAIEFDSTIAVSKWKERVEPILATFEQLHGHRNVPRDFVVPSTPPWREKDWGIQLGKLEPR
ncbi:hypothetical protein PR003_g29685 [Phytophthora rubi]|uniref:Helicase-associated domain-containing protein n=1 Tax=Phytophthora rubi TaxID=129364 RepID=A0A6A4BL39_9STRA|nr:hypothetical protein PR003_g29685 [Phytophthora rubi]